VKLGGNNYLEQEINLYPNPISISDQVNLTVNNLIENKATQVLVFDYQGKSIMNYTAYTDESGNLNEIIPTNELVKGVYFIRISGVNAVLTKKLIVQ